MVVAFKGLIQYELAVHVGDLGRKINRKFNINLAIEEMTGDVDAMF